MTPCVRVGVAPNFHLPGTPAVRLLVADGAGWRSPGEGEGPALVPQAVPPGDLSGLVLLFALPGHLRSSFWAVLEQAGPEQPAHGWQGAGFDAFASEVGRFLTFK
jgi:hypothetical protein